jgi:hypothetical protein
MIAQHEDRLRVERTRSLFRPIFDLQPGHATEIPPIARDDFGADFERGRSDS